MTADTGSDGTPMKDTPDTACRRVLLSLGDHLDGSLSAGERSAVERHLATCAACRAEAAVMARIEQRLGQVPEAAAPPELLRNVMDAVRAERVTARPSSAPSPRAWFPGLSAVWRFALVGAAAMAVVALVATSPWTSSRPTAPELAAVMPPPSAERTASVVLVGGVAVVRDGVVDGGTEPVRLESGARFTLPADGTAVLELADGSRVVATQRADVEVMVGGLRLEGGRLDLTMAPTGLGFLVQTPHADVVVRGTVYSVTVADETVVRVREGAVSVEATKSGEHVLVRAGDAVAVSALGTVAHRSDVAPRVEAADEAEDTRLDATDEN